MIRRYLVYIICLLSFTPRNWAAPGVSSSATSGFHNPKDTTGMCTPDNKEQEFYQVGYCKSIYEKLVKPGCANDTLEELRLRRLGDEKDPKFKKLKNKKYFDPGFECDSKDGKKHMSDIAKDPAKFSRMMMQFFALLAVNESDWDSKSKKSTDDNSAQGLLNLSRKDMDDKKYECGCKTDDTTDGKSPGPQDGHYSLTCGSYMAMYWMEKDGVGFEGKSPKKTSKNTPDKTRTDDKDDKTDKGDDRKGASRLFKSLEGTQDGGESKQVQTIRAKMKAYCEKYAFNDLGEIEDDLNLDKNAAPDAVAKSN